MIVHHLGSSLLSTNCLKRVPFFNKDKSFLFSFRHSMQSANETGAFLDVADAYKFVIDDVAKKKELEAKKLELLDNLNDNLKEALERLASASV